MKIRRQQPSPPIAIESLRYQVISPENEPRNILEKIVWHKEKEVEKMRDRLSLLDLRKKVAELSSFPLNFLSALHNSEKKPALIAEVKKASPSKGVIKENFDPITIAKSYETGGASCLSVLTDEEFFQGSFENLAKVRAAVKIPLLCKEFIIYPYQIYLARVNGADAVLLIAAILKDNDLQYFLKIIHSLGMTALIEVHTLEELDRVLAIDDVKLIGINNRNLEDFTLSLDTTKDILSARKETIINKQITIVSESGLYTKNDLDFVKNAGANAVLIGESLIKQDELELAIDKLYNN
ncbi:indole-3-glycerol phosphate synthase [Geminocystis sp. NIES-3708]|uniref:indole-3-glycerol phosphate synthase TrpC n=1 Tax=Geminocystis sp. NIES-3708 TaxID=1615909 RepID=UPI0005FC7C2C|nr:indole-3-glycerol phosphate synthase TrpC [Geminocystis sp. NIES-3708]BAQ60941.1 indole-3-glycerol phosphate synthase [Geminocystis sp. NIES-3708]